MDPGQRRHVVTVEKRTQTQDASGDPVDSWTSMGTLRAKISPIRGREATYAGDQVLGEMDTRINVRWSPLAALITVGHRLTHQGTLFNVVSPAHIDLAQKEVEILCKSGLSDG